MSLDLLLAATLFAVVMTCTPGPNTLMLMTSALNFGIRPTMPHAYGVTIGYTFMALVIGLGLGATFTLYPMLNTILKYAGAAYMLWLAWIIGNSVSVKEGERKGRPLKFLEAAAFQWINVKAVLTSITAMTTYGAISVFPWNAILIAFIFLLSCILACVIWVGFGSMLRRVLKEPRHIRIFNIVMAVLLVASLYPVFADGWS